MTMTRKQFLQLSAGAAAATIIGCADEGGGGDSTGTPGTTTDASTGGPLTSGPGDSTGPSQTTGASTSGASAETGSTGPAGTTAEDSTGPGGTSSGGAESTGAEQSTSSGGGVELCGDGAETEFDGHVHTLTISAADIMAGDEQDYVAGGGHTHPVHISAAQFATLLETGTVVVSAGDGGFGPHMHTVTITCV